MANIAATDITVTILNSRKDENSKRRMNVKLAFGNGVLTYGAGGIPISKGKLGCPNVIESLVVYDKGTSGYEWSYDAANSKLVAMRSAANTAAAHTHVLTMDAHAHDILLKDGSTVDGAGTRVNAAANKLGANTGGDLTVAGAGANGGVQNATATGTNAATTPAVAAAVLAEPSTVAIAAQVLRVEVVGW